MSSYLKKAFVDRQKKIAAEDITDNKVAHSMVNTNWRPLDIQGDLNIPLSVATLIEICWLDDQDARPAFQEIVDYLTTHDPGGSKPGTGTGRKISMSSENMASRIEEEQQKKATMKKNAAESVMSDAIVDSLKANEMDTVKRT